jgi:hypothetical protein
MNLLNFPADEVLRQLKAGKRAYQLLSEPEHADMRARTSCEVVFAEHAEPIALPEDLR